MWRLLLLFTVVPALELLLLLQLGSLMGPTATFLLILLTGVAGAWLAKREGFSVLMDLRRELEKGLPPGDRMMEGVMVLVGGLLLVTPGILTDLFGFSLIVPATRKFLAPRLLGWLGSQVDVQVMADFGPMGGHEGAGDHREPEVRRRDPLRPPRSVPGSASRSASRTAPTSGAQEANPFANKFDDLP